VVVVAWSLLSRTRRLAPRWALIPFALVPLFSFQVPVLLMD